MAGVSWPAGLPYRPYREAYRLQSRFQAPLKTEMEDGPVRQRRVATARWAKLAYQISFKAAEYDIADDFVVNTLADGTARFMMPVDRPYRPLPWGPKLVFLDAETWGASLVQRDDKVLSAFTLNVLDW